LRLEVDKFLLYLSKQRSGVVQDRRQYERICR